MLFLLVWGGVKVCAQTNLKITGGTNWNGYPGPRTEEGTPWSPSNDGEESGLIQFHDNTPKNCRVGGKGWATAYTGTPQTFTVTLNNYFLQRYNDNPETNLASNFVLVAVKGGEYNGNDLTNNDTYNWNGNDFKNGDGTSTLKVVATTGAQSTFKNNQLVLELEVNEAYDAVYLYHSGSGGYKYIKVESIVRTEGASVAAPTISPVSGTYDEDEDLIVTITKGEGNAKVIYSVSGATTGNVTDAMFTETSKTLTLTGTGTITVTAIGYDAENNPSSEVRNTYTTDVPSGKTSIASDNRTLPYTFNSADDNIEFNQNKFNNENIVIGNYVVLDINVVNDNTWFCFKKGWGDYPFTQCTSIYSGNSANDCWVNKNDTYWWMKISDQNAVNAFTGNNVQIKGSKIKGTNNYSAMTVNSFSIYKSRAISESENNTISSKENNVVVELTRSLVADNWNTICLPFALTSAQATQLFGEGYRLAEFTSVSGTTMQFTTAASFEAGVPYLVKPTIDVSNANPVVLVDVSITAKTPQTVPHGDYSFVGNFTKKTFTSADNTTSRFVAAENELVTPNENSTLKSLRCYFTVPAAAARSLSFDVDEEGNTTGVADINRETITNNGDFFNLAGQRVAKPTKGLYIVNGKKVVIK